MSTAGNDRIGLNASDAGIVVADQKGRCRGLCFFQEWCAGSLDAVNEPARGKLCISRCHQRQARPGAGDWSIGHQEAQRCRDRTNGACQFGIDASVLLAVGAEHKIEPEHGGMRGRNRLCQSCGLGSGPRFAVLGGEGGAVDIHHDDPLVANGRQSLCEGIEIKFARSLKHALRQEKRSKRHGHGRPDPEADRL